MTLLLKSWILIAIVAYFFHAATAIIDKFLLEKRISRPSTYAFWVGIFSIFALLLSPLGFFIPPLREFLLAVLSGFLSVFAFYTFFLILQKSEASRIAPVIGGFSPVFVLLLSHFFLGESLEWIEFAAFFILIAGGVLISLAIHPVRSSAKNSPSLNALSESGLRLTLENTIGQIKTSNGVKVDGIRLQKSETKKIFFIAVLTALLFALTYVLFKAATNYTPFLNAFIWSRLGGFAAAFVFLLAREARNDILGSLRLWFTKFKAGQQEEFADSPGRIMPLTSQVSTWALFMLNKFLGATGFFLLDYAISIGRVSVINAMQGVEYTLIFVFAVLLSKKYPEILAEDFGHFVFFQKVLGIILVAGGLVLLAFG